MVRTRRQANEPRAVVAAATRIKLSDKKLAKKQAGRRQAWQEDAWEFFDLVGFVKQSLWLLGNSIAKTRLFVAVENPNDPDGDPIPASDPTSGVPSDVAQQAAFELSRLKGPLGGLSEILRELDMNLEVPGEGYLVGLGPRPEKRNDRTDELIAEAVPESWSVRSTSEVDVTSGGVYKVRDDPGTQAQALDPDLDTCIRFWIPHPRFSHLPDSAMHGELEDLETLLILSRQRRAEGKSRLPSGLLLLAADITAASPVQTEQDDGENSGSGDVVLDTIADAISDAIEDESSAAGLAPVALRVPVAPNEKVTDKVAKIDLSRTSDSYLDTRIDKLVESVARGLNLPVESVMGHQQTTYANAEQVDEDKFYDHIEPRLLLIVDLLTIAFLRPQLTADDEAGVAAGPQFVEWAPKLFVWYDPSALLSKPNLGANASEAFDRNAISERAYRAALGYSDDDAPDALELLIRAGLRRGILTANLTKALLDLLGEDINVEPLPVAAPGAFDPTTKEAVPKEVPSGDVVPAPAAAASAMGDLRELATLLLMRDAQRDQQLAAHAEPIPVTSSTTHTPHGTPHRQALARAAADNPGRQLMDIDRELRTRLLAHASDAMNRALTTAGNRAKQRLPEARALVRKVDPRHVLRTLGPSIVAAGGVTDDELLADSFDELESTFMSLGATAQADALALASEIGTGFTIEQREAYQLRQAADLVEAWAWLKEQLITLASTRMFDPATDTPLGEFDPTLSVPASLIRQAVTRAGGTVGVQTSGAGDAWVVLADGGSRPAGGIGTGELIRDALGSGGMSVEAYRWVYGPAARQQPFEEHVALDGQISANFDDAALSNDASWPGFDFYFPGDHAGCQCDVEPIVVDASELA